jgi:hypothetical protein
VKKEKEFEEEKEKYWVQGGALLRKFIEKRVIAFFIRGFRKWVSEEENFKLCLRIFDKYVSIFKKFDG